MGDRPATTMVSFRFPTHVVEELDRTARAQTALDGRTVSRTELVVNHVVDGLAADGTDVTAGETCGLCSAPIGALARWYTADLGWVHRGCSDQELFPAHVATTTP